MNEPLQDIEAELAADEAAFEAQIAGRKNPSSLNPVAQADATEPDPVHGTTTETKAPDTGSSTQPAAKDDQQKKPEDAKPEDAPKTDPAAKEPSKYQKSVEREKRGWAKLNEEKAQIEADRKKFEADRQAFEAERTKATQSEAKPSPEAYERIAKEYDAGGDFKLASEARNMAAERRSEIEAEKAKAVEPTPIYPEARFKEMQASAFRQAVKEFPDLGNPNSAFATTVRTLMTSEAPIAELIKTSPNGLYFVARFASEQARAARVPDLEKQVARLTSELATLRTRTSPLDEQPVNNAGTPNGSRWNDLSVDEQERQLEAEIAASR